SRGRQPARRRRSARADSSAGRRIRRSGAVVMWPFTPAIAAYLVVAALVWLFGLSLVGDSATGRRGMPVIAVLWPMAVLFVLLIGAIAALDRHVDRALEQALGPDGGDA